MNFNRNNNVIKTLDIGAFRDAYPLNYVYIDINDSVDKTGGHRIMYSEIINDPSIVRMVAEDVKNSITEKEILQKIGMPEEYEKLNLYLKGDHTEIATPYWDMRLFLGYKLSEESNIISRGEYVQHLRPLDSTDLLNKKLSYNREILFNYPDLYYKFNHSHKFDYSQKRKNRISNWLCKDPYVQHTDGYEVFTLMVRILSRNKQRQSLLSYSLIDEEKTKEALQLITSTKKPLLVSDCTFLPDHILNKFSTEFIQTGEDKIYIDSIIDFSLCIRDTPESSLHFLPEESKDPARKEPNFMYLPENKIFSFIHHGIMRDSELRGKILYYKGDKFYI